MYCIPLVVITAQLCLGYYENRIEVSSSNASFGKKIKFSFLVRAFKSSLMVLTEMLG